MGDDSELDDYYEYWEKLIPDELEAGFAEPCDTCVHRYDDLNDPRLVCLRCVYYNS